MAFEINRHPNWGQFAAWAFCGASALLILGGAFTPLSPLGALVTAVSLTAALLLGGANVSAVGALAGVAAWPLAYAPFAPRTGASIALAGIGLGIGGAAVAVFCVVRRRTGGTVGG